MVCTVYAEIFLPHFMHRQNKRPASMAKQFRKLIERGTQQHYFIFFGLIKLGIFRSVVIRLRDGEGCPAFLPFFLSPFSNSVYWPFSPKNLKTRLQLPAVRRRQPISIGSNFFKYVCPFPTNMVTTTTTTTFR